MGYNLLITGVYWGYNPLTNHLLSSWYIQVFMAEISSLRQRIIDSPSWLGLGGSSHELYHKFFFLTVVMVSSQDLWVVKNTPFQMGAANFAYKLI